MSREAMQMALDMLNEIADDVYCDQKLEGVITALRQALEKQWVGLTDEEVSDAIDDVLEGGGWLDVARALEAAIKEKNT